MKPYDLKVSDLMSTALITVTASEPVTEAHAEMELGLIHHLPVIDDRGRLVGVLSDRDLLRAASSKRPRRVAEIMTHDVVTTRPDAPAHEAAAQMLDLKIGALPVVDEHGTLVGLVTQTDYLDLARRALLGLPLER
jgi:CBS domain-containing protein